MDNKIFIRDILISDFRNHKELSLNFSSFLLAFVGPNGVGKTNILEAISLLLPGKGLRNAKMQDFFRIEEDKIYPWAINANIDIDGYEYNIGTGVEDLYSSRRKYRTDYEDKLNDYLSIIWLTPQMDPLFRGPSSDRRKFIDRMVYDFYSPHLKDVLDYEKLSRNRMKILQESNDQKWLDITEKNMSDIGIKIHKKRKEIIEIVQDNILSSKGDFPKLYISLTDDSDSLNDAELYLTELFNNRNKDKFSSRTNFGINKNDMNIIHAKKNMQAKFCSTGEQKSMLISLILAKARAKSEFKKPILLLDEIVAHLDINRRGALLEELEEMGIQLFMTATDAEFLNKYKSIEILEV